MTVPSFSFLWIHCTFSHPVLKNLFKLKTQKNFIYLRTTSLQIDFNLMLRKEVYPYTYMIDFTVFGATELPPPCASCNNLTNESISEANYLHAQTVWENFNIQDLGKYHDLYVKTYVLLLAYVFENFRKLCREFYDLDLTHCFIASRLSWQACLKMTEIELEVFTNIGMLLFVEQWIRGSM